MPQHALATVFLIVIVALSTSITASTQVPSVHAEDSGFKYAGSWSGELEATWTEAHGQEASTWKCTVKLAFTVQDVGSEGKSAPLAGKAKVILQQPHYVHHHPNITHVAAEISPTEYVVGITGTISLDPPQLSIYPDEEPAITASLVFFPREGEPSTWRGTWQIGVLWLFAKLTYVEETVGEPPITPKPKLVLFTSYQSDPYSVKAGGEVVKVLYPTWGLSVVADTYYGNFKVLRDDEERAMTIDAHRIGEYDEYSGEYRYENYAMLQVGDTVITASETQVKIVIPEENASLVVGESSRVSIKQLGRGERDRELEFSWGKMWIGIDGARFLITTPFSTIWTRGTELSLEVAEDGTTTIIVLEGSAEFSDLTRTKTVLVEQHETSVVRAGGKPSDPTSIDPGQIDRWWEIVEEKPSPRPTPTLKPTPTPTTFWAGTMPVVLAVVLTALVAGALYLGVRRRRRS
ncbi:FecR family protein [Candidatus Hecatella orcuttiae]|jgi:hypothetical protein|uniref:FecR family protein n=1 Tax=Candidatus Hecatella orcuttiae TaxID=1935119 RepID=UPI002867EDE7|nr:FecR family protein [Candidatus Hecatella orcuttiae]